ncbi:enterobactin synthetase component F [Litoreibacter meonggei]|uniref:Enterobactin synthetase component F n=1 Tax=Litoreibacter meonggei TaxID=1049199 RepID=A0A497V664_9RHOB|nr:AMP-binding protein [Litoreibacter meonggei]RLJ36198.1 enterobactin synthetase component F [Litoreibacter meonggei]
MTTAETQVSTAKIAPVYLHELITPALKANPDHCAFRFRGAELTCADLLKAARHAATRLSRLGLVAGEPVAVEIEHSFELVIGMCGVVMSGGCVVPIDPTASEERRRAILADINPRLVMTRSQQKSASCPPGSSASIDIVDNGPGQVVPADPDLAFVVYTSGSGGGPKGVEITHANYTGRLQKIIEASPSGAGTVDLAWTPSSFIGMLDEIFYPLLMGFRAVIADPNGRTEPRDLANLIAREGITTFRITPSLLDVFLRSGVADRLGGVRRIFCSGETLSADLQKRAHDLLNADIVGFYGATEAPGVAFHAYDRNAPPLETSICMPQVFAAICVTGADGRDVDVGETGEIWIGGCAVARGYRGKPDLSAEKFVQRDGAQWYRTGDLGRRLDGGRIEVLGRLDLSEVKIHGVRVSLPEIREALGSLPLVADAWVSVVTTAQGGDPILVAHYVATDGVDAAPRGLKSELSSLLPSAAVPRALIERDHFPLTANGKLDIQKLAQEASAFLASASKTEITGDLPEPGKMSSEIEALLPVVIDVAEEILNVEGLSGRDNFFAAGGNSLLAVHCSLALSERLGVDIMTTLIFNTETLLDIAEAIASGRGHAAASLRLLRNGDGEEPPLFTVNATGNYSVLAAQLGGTYPVYNLNIFGLTNDLIETLDTVALEDLAVRLAEQIYDAHPTGPYRLLAYCQDGCLAIETARVLQQRHGAICSLLLIDTFFMEHRTNPKMLLMRAVDLGASYYFKKLKGMLRKQKAQDSFADIDPERRAALMGKSQNDQRLYRRYTELFTAYRPSVFEGQVALFVSQEWRRANLSCVQEMAQNGLTVAYVPGLHNTLFTQEDVPNLAAAIDAELPRLQGRRTC